MPLKVASRGRVPPFIVMDVMRAANERAAAGEDVLHLEIGQPGTPAPRAVLAGLSRRGHQLRQILALGHVNAFHCPKGLQDNPESCVVANDPRGFGLAYVAQ